MAHPYGRLVALIALLAIWPGGRVAEAGPRYNLITHKRIVLEIRPLTAPAVKGTPSPLLLEIDPKSGGALEFDVHWPTAADRTTVRLTATDGERSSGEPGKVVTVIAEIVMPGGKTAANRRQIATDDSSTTLFEVARSKSKSLTLGMQAEIVTRSKVETGAVIGAPVRLRLEVQRVIDGREVPLETNYLNTFVGEAVSYSFRLGPPDDTTMTVRLKPLRITGELLKLEVEISGMLPGGGQTNVSSRREEWITSRGTASTAALEVGDPPSGYRFIVTPQF